MSDNIIKLGDRLKQAIDAKKNHQPNVGRGLVKPEGFIAEDQDMDFNHRFENCTTETQVNLSDTAVEAVPEFVRLATQKWLDQVAEVPEALDLLTIHATAVFPGKDLKPTNELYTLSLRMERAIYAFSTALRFDANMLQKHLRRYLATVRAAMFTSPEHEHPSRMNVSAYNGQVNIALNASNWGVFIDYSINGQLYRREFVEYNN